MKGFLAEAGKFLYLFIITHLVYDHNSLLYWLNFSLL